jgi:hypothetical protein
MGNVLTVYDDAVVLLPTAAANTALWRSTASAASRDAFYAADARFYPATTSSTRPISHREEATLVCDEA